MLVKRPLVVSSPQSISHIQTDEYEAPVIVWIHGGGYVVGSKSTQGSSGDPTGLLKAAQQNNGKGAVFVSLNYRLGAFVSLLLTIDRAKNYIDQSRVSWQVLPTCQEKQLRILVYLINDLHLNGSKTTSRSSEVIPSK